MNLINHYIATILIELTTFTGSVGLAIIIFTALLRLLLYPLTARSLRSARKMQAIQPEIKALQVKYKKDPQALQRAQLELYKEKKINPFAGCLPQLLQLGLLILLYRGFLYFFSLEEVGNQLSTHFFWTDLSGPDPLFILPFLAGASQFVLSKMMMGTQKSTPPTQANKPAPVTEKKEEPGLGEMMQSMQKQMVYTMPIMTGLIALKLPSGLVLYWVVTTLVSLLQQWHVNQESQEPTVQTGSSSQTIADESKSTKLRKKKKKKTTSAKR